jgi:hypothetical protein
VRGRGTLVLVRGSAVSIGDESGRGIAAGGFPKYELTRPAVAIPGAVAGPTVSAADNPADTRAVCFDVVPA